MHIKAQIWIETVLYTVIALALIGVVLSIVTPRIAESRDRAVILQTMEALTLFDDSVRSTLPVSGNIRPFEFLISRGALSIDSTGDQVVFVIDEVGKPYSQIDKTLVGQGGILVRTTQLQKDYAVTLTLNYTGWINITVQSEDINKTMKSGPTPYKIRIENIGIHNERPTISIRVVD